MLQKTERHVGAQQTLCPQGLPSGDVHRGAGRTPTSTTAHRKPQERDSVGKRSAYTEDISRGVPASARWPHPPLSPSNRTWRRVGKGPETLLSPKGGREASEHPGDAEGLCARLSGATDRKKQ